MPKSALEKQLEKQMKQAKQIADKQQRENKKREREETHMAQKAAIRDRALAIVNGQPIIGGMRIMDDAAEEILEAILSVYSDNANRCVCGDADIFPAAYRQSLSFEFEKLCMYGVLSAHSIWITGGWEATLAPQGISYFDAKEQALKCHREEQKMQSIGNITNYGNIVFGNVSDSTLSVDNSIHEIERMIDAQGGEDAQELHDLLEEVKELVENMQSSRSIPKQKRLFQKISDHMAKHGWFYGAVVQLLGTAALSMLGAQ